MNFDFEILFFKAKWKNVAFCLAVILILKQSLAMVVQYYTLFFQRSQCSVPALDTLWDYNSLSAKCLLFLTRTCVLFFICSDDNLVTTSFWSWWGTHT